MSAVTDFPRPSTVKELQMFLGMVNFYRRFLPGAARALKPLTDCLRGGPKGPTAVEWNGEREAAFTEVKQMLPSATRLAHPAQAAKLSLAVDASYTLGPAYSRSGRGRRVGSRWVFSPRS